MFSEPNSVSVQLIQASPFIAFYGKGGGPLLPRPLQVYFGIKETYHWDIMPYSSMANGKGHSK